MPGVAGNDRLANGGKGCFATRPEALAGLLGSFRTRVLFGALPSYVGRTTADAPEVDCVVVVEGTGLHSEDLVNVLLTRQDAAYDLSGHVVGSPTDTP